MAAAMRLAGMLGVAISGLAMMPAYGQLSTEDHVAEPGFWPTRDLPSRAGLVGAESCAQCHGAMVKSHATTPMGRTAMPAAAAEILHQHPALHFESNGFRYRIDTGAKGSSVSVGYADGRGTSDPAKRNAPAASLPSELAYPLTWAFGTGRVAQSYLFKKDDGKFYESRVTYFTHMAAIDFTPARALKPGAERLGLEEALDREVGAGEVLRCFACHSTGANIGGRFDEQHLTPGVGCEACHGPGAAHVSVIKGGPGAAAGPKAGDGLGMQAGIFNSGHLRPADAVDFCGACHGSWWDVKLAGTHGVATTRSAPYRLVTSKCWGEKGDQRLTCTACHDPHKQLQTEAAAYDARCLSCHLGGAKPASGSPVTLSARITGTHASVPAEDKAFAKACPKATERCTSCHMAKVMVPEMHSEFTDHRIRIVRAGEPFPE